MIVIKNILVATDFGEASETALNYGRSLARQFDARLHVLHVIQNLYFSTATAYGYAYVPAALRARSSTRRNKRPRRCSLTRIATCMTQQR